MYLSRILMRALVLLPKSAAAASGSSLPVPVRSDAAKIMADAAINTIAMLCRMTRDLFIMVGLPTKDRERPVQLLCKNRAHHLMGESHLGKGHLCTRPGVNLR